MDSTFITNNTNTNNTNTSSNTQHLSIESDRKFLLDNIYPSNFNYETLKEIELSFINTHITNILNLEAFQDFKRLDILNIVNSKSLNTEGIHLIFSLRTLRLVNCNLTCIPKEINTLYNLIELNLSENKINEIKYISNINLKKIELYMNNISKLEFLQDCILLEELNLNSNRLTKIENLDNLSNLKVLKLAENNIKDMNNISILAVNTKLVELYFEDEDFEPNDFIVNAIDNIEDSIYNSSSFYSNSFNSNNNEYEKLYEKYYIFVLNTCCKGLVILDSIEVKYLKKEYDIIIDNTNISNISNTSNTYNTNNTTTNPIIDTLYSNQYHTSLEIKLKEEKYNNLIKISNIINTTISKSILDIENTNNSIISSYNNIINSFSINTDYIVKTIYHEINSVDNTSNTNNYLLDDFISKDLIRLEKSIKIFSNDLLLSYEIVLNNSNSTGNSFWKMFDFEEIEKFYKENFVFAFSSASNTNTNNKDVEENNKIVKENNKMVEENNKMVEENNKIVEDTIILKTHINQMEKDIQQKDIKYINKENELNSREKSIIERENEYLETIQFNSDI